MATGDTPLQPHSPSLRHSGGDLNLVAHHILLPLSLHQRSLHLTDPNLRTPHIAAPAPAVWAEMAPVEVADYLWRACH